MRLPKLQPGDGVRVIAPSHSLAIISKEVRELAKERLESLELAVSFGKHLEECDEFLTSPVASRIEDLHDAYRDSSVKAVMAVIGGYAANQLLPHIDWDIIRSNPKPLIGYSDTTALQVAMYTKTGLVSYSGPAFSTFGQAKYFEYTFESFRKSLMEDGPFQLEPATEWTDDLWFLDQDNRNPIPNQGWGASGSGSAMGTILGANLSTFRLLQGTEYFPSLKDSILFLEDDDLVSYSVFDRELESLIQTPGFEGVRGMVIGRFQKKSEIDKEKILRLISSKQALSGMPVIVNVDFGHTSPMCTYPIGGMATISVGETPEIMIH